MTPHTRHFSRSQNLPHKAATPAVFPNDWRGDALSDWVARQYRTVSLPDARLEKRLLTVAQTLAAKPHDSINQACDNWAGAKGAYRFVENEAVTPAALIQPLTDAAAREAAAHGVVIAVQDTTVLSFPRARQAKGLGPVNDLPEARGMLVHPALALRLDGAPLGLLDLQYWCRDVVARDPSAPDDAAAPARKASRPIEQKESAKWLRGIAAARQAIADNIDEARRPRLIHVLDREGDIHEVFDLVTASNGPNTSSCSSRDPAGTSAMTVGCRKYPSPAFAARPPPVITRPSFFPTSMYSRTDFIEPSLITAPMLAFSAGSPMVIFSTRAFSFAKNTS